MHEQLKPPVNKGRTTPMQLFIAVAAALLLVIAGYGLGRLGDHERGMMHQESGVARDSGGSMMGTDGPDASNQGGMSGAPIMDNTTGAGMGGGMMGAMRSMQVDSEAGYLAQMIPHHEEAIAAAKVLKAGSQREELREFADGIIRTQQAELKGMTQWLKRWHPDTMIATYEPMMRTDLDQLKGSQLDDAFLQDMVMHHMMAVRMSQQLLRGDIAEHDEVADLARSIRSGQMTEISQMQEWLAE